MFARNYYNTYKYTKTPYVASLILLPRSNSYPVSYAQPKSQIFIDSPWPFFTSSYNQCIWCTLNMVIFLHVSSAFTVVIIPTVPPSNRLWITMYIIIHLLLLLAQVTTLFYATTSRMQYCCQTKKIPSTGHTIQSIWQTSVTIPSCTSNQSMHK